MAKKRSNRFVEEQRKKKKQEQDSLLETGLTNSFNSLVDNEGFELDPEPEQKSRRSKKDDAEEDYELKPRSLNIQEEGEEGLPIKQNGKITRVIKSKSKKEEQKDEEEELEEEEEEHNQDQDEKHQEPEEPEVDTVEKIQQLKEEISELVSRLQEEPEEHIDALNRLIRMAQSRNLNTSRFSILALVPALNSIIPGYRIRPLTELEKKEKVTKDVQKLRNFEQKLVFNYKSYIDLLTQLNTKSNLPNSQEMGQIAIKAACELALSFPHFNYRSDVLVILIRRICRPGIKNDPVFSQCIKTLENLLKDDDEGDISWDIVRLLTKTIKSRGFRIDEAVVNVFLSINILNDYDPSATEEEREEKRKLRKKDRVHLSKKERKQRKERKEIEEELRKAEQKITTEEREKFQAEILKQLMKTYLETLRMKPHELIASILEGLAKIGHMVNFELLGDFLQVIKEIIRDATLESQSLTDLEIRQILLSIATAFALISNHSQYKVSIDLSGFIDSLYTVLYQLSINPLIEFSHKSLRIYTSQETTVKPSVNISTEIELLLRSLEQIFFKSKNGTAQRATSFTKKLFMMTLQTPEKTSIALLKFLEKLMNRHSSLPGLFASDDRVLNGEFKFNENNTARSNCENAVIYETLLLEKHFCPEVSKGMKVLMDRWKAE
ncbi:hypothetical protein WICMUC_004291 [Wickerhamomyces mucosus]|uniref:Nucleolar complex-associated protein 3 n=1 Tax=Wickerhamomyces mucosus TaxID=1378264 RepID=A0A9P8TBE2_9ASCO|nr:hypothetical protein WICMUC_004291 [Wickerhamomyces mucosus]